MSTKLAPALVLVLGLGLLATAIPALVSAALLAPVSSEMAALQKSDTSEVNFARLHSRYTAAAEWWPLASTKADLGLVLLAQERRENGLGPSAERWQPVSEALIASLRARPLDSLTLGRLAYAEQQGGGALTIPAYLLSLETGTYLPSLQMWRMLQGLTLWSQLDAPAQQLVAEQAYWVLRKNTRDFVRMARVPATAARLEMIVRTYYPERLERFLRMRGKVRHTAG